jgi:hypothetical protein
MKKIILAGFLSIITLFSCNKENSSPNTNTSNTSNNNSINIDTNNYYLVANIDGNSYGCEVKQNTVDWNISQSNAKSGDGDNLNLALGGGITNAVLIGDSIDIKSVLNINFNYSNLDQKSYNTSDDIFITLINKGEYLFTNNRVNVSYSINNGTEYWLSELGDQTGSKITVTSKKINSNNYNETTMDIQGTFNCKLYSQNNPTKYITITNGKFKLNIQK